MILLTKNIPKELNEKVEIAYSNFFKSLYGKSLKKENGVDELLANENMRFAIYDDKAVARVLIDDETVHIGEIISLDSKVVDPKIIKEYIETFTSYAEETFRQSFYCEASKDGRIDGYEKLTVEKESPSRYDLNKTYLFSKHFTPKLYHYNEYEEKDAHAEIKITDKKVVLNTISFYNNKNSEEIWKFYINTLENMAEDLGKELNADFSRVRVK